MSAELRNGVNVFLDLGTGKQSSPREICVNLGEPVQRLAGADLGLQPAAVACGDMHWNTSDSGSLTTLAAGSDLAKRMQVAWEAGGGTYYLRWGTTAGDWVTVTCRAAGSKGCTSWTVEGSLAARVRLSFTSKRSGWVDVADYVVPVAIGIER